MCWGLLARSSGHVCPIYDVHDLGLGNREASLKELPYISQTTHVQNATQGKLESSPIFPGPERVSSTSLKLKPETPKQHHSAQEQHAPEVIRDLAMAESIFFCHFEVSVQLFFGGRTGTRFRVCTSLRT